MHRSDELILQRIQDALYRAEEEHLSPLACRSCEARWRHPDTRLDYRQSFARDADRILHSRAYSRYIDKTQVFSLVDNDHITHRVLHVQMVSRIGRTVGRFLGLNEDLIEAIALGHDIGHPPFGHEGERILDKLCRAHGLEGFQHNIQSVQFLERFERKGAGWNLTLQVLDGILCHDGEVHNPRLAPCRDKDFARLDQEIRDKGHNPRLALRPMTLEGCVVRLCDTIAYVGRDIEDAVELGLIRRDEIPERCSRRLGSSNGSIVYNLVTDLLLHSHHVRERSACRGSDQDWIGLGEETAELLLELKKFNYERIYKNPSFKPDFEKIHICYERLFAHYLRQLEKDSTGRGSGRDFLQTMSEAYLQDHPAPAVVRDYLAGMTDDFFLRQAQEIGCRIPERTCLPN
ncbi:deoxyguanosinetriphosphate triphosphohydrolase [Desulfolithobacter dissulfuricans]|uniref:Deoxyguanosinetriphosphate triphosphohydrolase n=1 Tax=Desulfolithobacter dissulfuricans TaxID=2795293 RepID=A0A915XKS9_9BACT|nr:dNTP triphosphohydrolase [Desulfolithobacter dissulfuricans]BCO09658.1 deoxyguanosinetriphosphate triphosphohydrolase [Desulfolithobacter dissulfuricans]